jgi:hypothetical protein
VGQRFPNFDYREYLQDHDVDFRERDSKDHIEITSNCPKCMERGEARADTKKRLWVNENTSDFHCYNCKWSGNLKDIVMHYSNTSRDGAVKILRGKTTGWLMPDFKLFTESYDLSEDEIHKKEISLPHGFQFFDDEPGESPFTDYLKKRGVALDYAREMAWGFCVTGFHKDRLVVPTIIGDKIVYWQARDILEGAHPDWDTDEYRKVRNPSGVSARYFLYQFETAKKCKRIWLTEGFIDAYKTGPDAVACNGKNLHAEQIELLRMTDAEEIVLLWDHDAYTDERYYQKGPKKGQLREASSAQKAVSMLKLFYKVRCVRLPKGKDAGDYSVEQMEKIKAKL